MYDKIDNYSPISKRFPKPAYVGVYCYNTYDNCTFYLTISEQIVENTTGMLPALVDPFKNKKSFI